MKSFKEMLGEVAQPKPEEERAFKDMHSYETMPHPVALDHQFTGEITGVGDSQRIADQKGDAAYDTAYDDAMEYIGPSFDESVELDEAEDLQELSISTLKSYIQKKVGKNARASEGLKAYYDLTKVPAFNNLGKADKESAMKLIKDQEALVKKSENGINIAKLKATAKADKLGVDMVFCKDGKAMGKSKMREQADQAIANRLEEKAVERKDYNPYAKSTKRAVQHANANKEIAKARNDAVKVGREVPTRRELENQRDKK